MTILRWRGSTLTFEKIDVVGPVAALDAECLAFVLMEIDTNATCIAVERGQNVPVSVIRRLNRPRTSPELFSKTSVPPLKRGGSLKPADRFVSLPNVPGAHASALLSRAKGSSFSMGRDPARSRISG